MDTVTLIWRAKTPEGWKRFPIVIGRNGHIKKGAVMVDGKEVSYPIGCFQLRYYENRKNVFRMVGTDATEAKNKCDRLQHLGDARASAVAAGVTINETATRKTIKAEAAKFVQSAEDRGAMEAASVNELAMAAFQLANPTLIYVDEITSKSATTFWRYLKKLGKADRTVYNAHMRLTGFLKFARVDYKAWGLRAPRYEKKLPNMYSPSELERMLAACKREYNRVLISILAKTGLREQELMYLCWTDIDLTERRLKVTGKPEYEWNIKDYEQRIIPLPINLVETLKAWRKENPATKLVLGTANNNPNTKYLLAIKSIAKNAGVLDATLHRFRRTYGTTMLRGGADFDMVRGLLVRTQRYSKHDAVFKRSKWG